MCTGIFALENNSNLLYNVTREDRYERASKYEKN